MIFSATQAPVLAVLEGGSTVPAIMVELTMAVLWARGTVPEPKRLYNFRGNMKKVLKETNTKQQQPNHREFNKTYVRSEEPDALDMHV